jgi:hypothetical protein
MIRRAAQRAAGLAQSPQETRLRLLLHRSSLPRPSPGTRSATPATSSPRWTPAGEHKLALKYEGVWHGRAQQVGKDRRRPNRLTAAGWTVMFVTAGDLRDPVVLVARIAAALNTPRYA